jgi:hypothetical protein
MNDTESALSMDALLDSSSQLTLVFQEYRNATERQWFLI